MDKVFVTGADGMLGNCICRELILQGYKIKAFCLNDKNSHTLSELDVHIVFGNVLDKESLIKEMADCNFVIHIAALTDLWPKRNMKVKSVNLIGTKNVMEVAQKQKMKRVVCIGSASSFAHGTKTNPGTENNPFNGWKHKMDYMESKFQAQELLLNEFKSSGFPVIIINPTYMIGPYDSAPSSGKVILSLYKKSLPGYPPGGKNFVCTQDVAVAAVNAIKMGRIGQCYIAGNQNMSYKEFFKVVGDVMERKFRLKGLPSWIVLLVGLTNSGYSRIRNKAPKVSFSITRLALEKQYYSAEKARNELKMPQTSIEVGVKQCLDWFDKNGYLS